MRRDYEVPGMVLCQVCLYAYSLLRGITFEVLLLSSHALISVMLSLLETFLKCLLWNSFQCHCPIFFFFFGSLQYSERFVPLRQTSSSEAEESHAN